MAGCVPRAELTEAQFYEWYCAIEDPRRFSQEEWAWRQANAPWNLTRDIETNLRRDDNCQEAE